MKISYPLSYHICPMCAEPWRQQRLRCGHSHHGNEPSGQAASGVPLSEAEGASEEEAASEEKAASFVARFLSS